MVVGEKGRDQQSRRCCHVFIYCSLLMGHNNRQQRENNAKHVIIPTACRSSDSPSYANVTISCYLSLDGTDCDINESPRISAEDGIFSSCRSDGLVSSRHITWGLRS